MSDVESWAVRGAVSAVVAAIAGLFLRVRSNESRLALAEKSISHLESAEADNKTRHELLIRIDERLRHLPTQDSLQALHDRISENGKVSQHVRTDVAAMAESVSGLKAAVGRLHDLELAREQK